MPPAISQIVTRIDDAGLCRSVNDAVLEVLATGLPKNVSVMVPGPAFADAAERLRERDDFCLGLHITLNAEWSDFKWRPLSPPSAVPSLLDAEGYLLASPKDFAERNASAAEMMEEIRRQLDAARRAGLNIRYIDEHMGVSWVCGLRPLLAEFARAEGLFDAHGVPSLPPAEFATRNPVAEWTARIGAAPAGAQVLVSHVGHDGPELRRCHLDGHPPGIVARERDAERRAWSDPRLRAAFDAAGARVIRYDELPGAPG